MGANPATAAELEIGRQKRKIGGVRRCASCGNIVQLDRDEHYAAEETRCKKLIPYLASS